MATTFSALSFQKKTLWLSFIFLVLATPLSMFMGKASTRQTDNLSCLAQHELSFLNFATLKFTRYDKECGEAQAIMAIANMGLRMNPPDNGMIATALATWRIKFPRMNEAMDRVVADLIKNPAPTPEQLTVPPRSPARIQ